MKPRHLLLAFALLLLSGCASLPFGAGRAMVVSVSSDGRYAVSSHSNRRLILWDLQDRRSETISRNANIYSAYFIKGRDAFLWQDLNDVVHVQSVEGERLLSFPHLPTYGHVISADFEHYFSSDAEWGLYYGHGVQMQELRAPGGGSFAGLGKLLNLTLSQDDRHLLMSGDGSPRYDERTTLAQEEAKNNYQRMRGVVLWDVATLEPLHKLPGNASKTHATLSPDGKHAVSGCENRIGFVWNTADGTRKARMASLFHGLYLDEQDPADEYGSWDTSRFLPPPKDLERAAILALKFIDHAGHYLSVLTYQHYAVLFHVDDPFPIKYLPLGKAPRPSVDEYSRNASIDTAPAANLLVMGEASGSGIIVYHYDPKTQTLKKEWAP
jgi:hypothetical protein